MRNILFAFAVLAAVASGFVLTQSAHADGGPSGQQACTSDACK